MAELGSDREASKGQAASTMERKFMRGGLRAYRDGVSYADGVAPTESREQVVRRMLMSELGPMDGKLCPIPRRWPSMVSILSRIKGHAAAMRPGGAVTPSLGGGPDITRDNDTNHERPSSFAATVGGAAGRLVARQLIVHRQLRKEEHSRVAEKAKARYAVEIIGHEKAQNFAWEIRRALLLQNQSSYTPDTPGYEDVLKFLNAQKPTLQDGADAQPEGRPSSDEQLKTDDGVAVGGGVDASGVNIGADGAEGCDVKQDTSGVALCNDGEDHATNEGDMRTDLPQEVLSSDHSFVNTERKIGGLSANFTASEQVGQITGDESGDDCKPKGKASVVPDQVKSWQESVKEGSLTGSLKGPNR